MKQREFAQKKRLRAASSMYHERRRYRGLLVTVVTIMIAVIVAIVYGLARHVLPSPWPQLWARTWPALVIGAIIGWLAASLWVRSAGGRRALAANDRRLNEKYSGDLHAGRRWQQFFYNGEEISTLIPRILYALERDVAPESLDAVIASVRATRYENPRFRARGREIFNSLTAATDLLLLSTSDERGQPSSRFMRFVTTDRPGVWYVTSAPDAPKIHEFDRGCAALLTVPTDSGATISSNRVRLRRSDKAFPDVADLYRAQVPRYLDGMTPADQACEVVYELTIESACVSSWEYNEVVQFENNQLLSARAATPGALLG
ncbi:hypothetical protein [Gryllotalpicola reticulitermitis]